MIDTITLINRLREARRYARSAGTIKLEGTEERLLQTISVTDEGLQIECGLPGYGAPLISEHIAWATIVNTAVSPLPDVVSNMAVRAAAKITKMHEGDAHVE